ncbi:caspase domain-containing protein [Mycena maculata]|uniref:Caspase domain-containing protein n=1 Tax=Mycena maculata TaxID=230809 RepID=A0AAD7KGL2_9AGAR|nr:caspase domain-containing protein [Mycena maculata]
MPICTISSLVELSLTLFTAHFARKKALLIGIKSGEKELLEGPHEAVQRFRTLLLTDKFGFEDENITMMIDDSGAGLQPTKANILAKLKTFLDGQRPGDIFYHADAGHAKQSICLDGTEEDNLDEFIITCDCPKNGYTTIRDDVLHEYLVKPLAPSSSLIAFLDTCHSETLLDLMHYRCNRPSRVRRALRRLREITGVPSSSLGGISGTSTKFCSGYCPRMNTSTHNPNVVRELPRFLRVPMDFPEQEYAPTLKMLMRALTKNAKSVYRAAKRYMEQKSLDKARAKQNAKENENENEVALVAEDSDDSEDEVSKVTKWAPQVRDIFAPSGLYEY